MPSINRIYREDGGRFIPGAILPAFIHNGSYFLVGVRVYQDGMVDDWGLGHLTPLAEFKRKARAGWIATQLPEGAKVTASGMPIWMTATDTGSVMTLEDFLAQVDDEIRELNGQPTTSDLCRAAYAAYRADPSNATKEQLRTAYFAVPKHLRRYLLGDMDSKDAAIREVLDDRD